MKWKATDNYVSTSMGGFTAQTPEQAAMIVRAVNDEDGLRRGIKDLRARVKMDLFVVKDHGEGSDLFMVVATSEEDALKKYMKDVGIDDDEWDDEARSMLQVRKFEVPTSDDPVVKIRVR